MISYEEKLDRDLDWALREGSMHFENRNAVHKTLRRITQKLDELRVPYALVGDMAMFFHGFRRFTEGVDILVTRNGLKSIREQLEGRGYMPPFSGSKNLRDTDTGVRIEFLITGGFPGDGKPKPVSFPDPAAVFVDIDGVRCLNLNSLLELKIASGMTEPGRLKDLADVQELIATLQLSGQFAEQLNPFVREKYRELWSAVRYRVNES
ncbi:MAG TPA: hypothetical protein VH120_09240 [Gemmataceae bacterium]|jgi:hypothetical protein|nr:hypothetical protein [Gemmataceae bacterium]